MNLYEKIKNKTEKLSLIGLGYVGMPIAVAFAKEGVDVIGFDLNKSKIELYKSGIDPTHEVGDDEIKNRKAKIRNMKTGEEVEIDLGEDFFAGFFALYIEEDQKRLTEEFSIS